MTIKSVFEIHRQDDKSRSQVVQCALTLAICKHAPVVIFTNPNMPPFLVAPNESVEAVPDKMTVMQKHGPLAVLAMWSGIILLGVAILLWMLARTALWARTL